MEPSPSPDPDALPAIAHSDTPAPAAALQPPDSPQRETQWLVHCSPERTLVARRGETGTVLVKIFEQGSLVDAEQETELAKSLAAPGVVTYRSAGLDPVTSKPSVTMDYSEGDNLERVVAESGPLPPRRAARLLVKLTGILSEFHLVSRHSAPYGVIHRDVKPANVLLTRTATGESDVLLLDLEHAIARHDPRLDQDAPASPGFTGGTHGYAPGESYVGAYPHPGFDVFGLGATLFFLLTGATAFPQRDTEQTIRLVRQGLPRLRLLRGQPPILRDLLERSLATDEHERPAMTEFGAALAGFLESGSEADANQDRALQALQAAELEAARSFLAQAATDATHDQGRQRDLLDLWRRRERLIDRLGGIPTIAPNDHGGGLADEADLVVVAEAVRVGLPRCTTILTHFPHHAPTLRTRREIANVGHERLPSVLPRVAEYKMAAEFEGARALLHSASLAAGELHRIPGGLSMPLAYPGHLPGPLVRNPERILARSLLDVENAERAHTQRMTRLQAAEADLDLRRASLVIDEITAIFGGASAVAAPLKDRLLRLDFYLQRIAWSQKLLGQLEELLELANQPHRLALVASLAQRCQERSISETNTARSKGGVRSLLDAMVQLVADFPHAQAALDEGKAALEAAMRSMTLEAWRCIAEARAKLDGVPIPIRPVQRLLNRLDGIRMLETFLDLPERSRERLQDEIERIRMSLDQARTTRDNIARGAEKAIEKGHLTTALFDMARAVDSFADDSADDDDGADDTAVVGQLSEQLERTKQLKKDLEAAIVENQRLAASYVELLEDESSTVPARLAVLERRAAVLDRLIGTLGPEKGAHYAIDLREVMLHLVHEKADHGERQLDRATAPEARLEIARDTLTNLREITSSPSVARDIGIHVRRLLDHWQSKVSELENHLPGANHASTTASRRTRRMHVSAMIAGLVLLAAGIGTWQVVYGEAKAPTIAFNPLTIRAEKPRLRFEFPRATAATAALSSFVDRLRSARLDVHKRTQDLNLLPIADGLVRHVQELIESTAKLDDVWQADLRTTLERLNRAIETLQRRASDNEGWQGLTVALESFARCAHLTGLNAALVSGQDWVTLEATSKRLQQLEHVALAPEELAHLLAITK